MAARKPPAIDRDRLRECIRRQGNELVCELLLDALDLLPAAKLASVAGRYLDLAELAPRADAPASRPLLEEVRAFDRRARAGAWYQAFDVDSRNSLDQSAGTTRFIAECCRLLDRAVRDSARGDAAVVRESFEVMFSLLRHIDECHDDVVFFADEGGTWQIDIDWDVVFPAWFHCLAATAGPEAFADAVVGTVDDFEEHARDDHFAAAMRAGSPAQAAALRLAVEASAGRRR